MQTTNGTTMQDQHKEEALFKLAKIRKQFTPDGFTQIGDYQDGVWECDYVSPYSKSAHYVNANVMLVLQDWCSSDSFLEPVCAETLRLGYTPGAQTNINLISFLKRYFNLSLHETYATNLFPFVKHGPMNAPIPVKEMTNAARTFTLPMIDIIKPKVVIAFGKSTGDGLRRALGLNVSNNMQEAISTPLIYNSSTIYTQAHPGNMGLNNRGRKQVDRDWQTMKVMLSTT
jgi:hypothetical protein